MEVAAKTNIDKVNIARTAILNKYGRLLVLWRADDDDYNPGGPDLPGGGVESGETPRRAAARETLEESGIDLPEAALKQVCEIVTEEKNGQMAKCLTRTFFAACVEDPTIRLNPREHQRHDFVPLDKARVIFAESTTKLQCLDEIVALQASGELAAA